MNLNSLTNKAKDLFAKRGGADALKEDAQELKDIATGQGSAGDKAKAAVEALKDPGAPGADTAQHSAGEPDPRPPKPGQPKA